MVKLKDIVRKGHLATKTLLSSATQTSSSSSNIEVVIGSKLSVLPLDLIGIDNIQRSKFAKQASEIVSDDNFLDELQEKIGSPYENESEDAFVSRAKERMRELLQAKLK
ncbi:hypothetical protein [Dickeya zeae]|uniref:hypothetical protein n=1 Tax=Dickeya zeae TaxID=204042 RepID=UPI000C9BE640|nr:hypothetical protein [Dickeya zeae]AUQ25432.1 hypothetical protein C1O30_10250 [Dickeya zeae]UJR58507.1 hypothetical protein HJ580_10140 [Dickeya zeae]